MNNQKMNVSVAMCTYNGAQFLKEQIDSILSQTCPVDEIVICDDGSTDDTKYIIEHYIKERIPIRYISNSHNLGYRKNFQQAYYLCTGDIVFFCDQDDIWMPNKVEDTLRYFSKNPEVEGVCSDGILIDEQGHSLKSTLFRSAYFDKYLDNGISKEDIFTVLTFCNNFVTGAAMAIRKGCVGEFGNTPLVHDYLIALELSLKGRFGVINQPLIKYRLHQGQSAGLRDFTKPYYINNYNLYTLNFNLGLYHHYLKRMRSYKRVKRYVTVDESKTAVLIYQRHIKLINNKFNELANNQGLFSRDYLNYIYIKLLYQTYNNLIYPIYLRFVK